MAFPRWGMLLGLAAAVGVTAGSLATLKNDALAQNASIKPASAPASAPNEAKFAAVAGDVAAIKDYLAKNCVDCHNADDKIGDTVLDMYNSASSIRKARTQWARVLAMVTGGAMPPKKAEVHPTKEENTKFLASAKAVLEYLDPTKPDPGRVTMRRLNRAEYSNSVRELLAVNFDPAADFPPDDVGGGFDNNADVLTLSPLLMEHYFSASDAVMDQAFPIGGNWPVFQKIEVWQPPNGTPGVFLYKSLGRERYRHLLPGQRITYTQDAVAATRPKNPGIKAENTNPIPVESDYHLAVMCFHDPGAGLEVPTLQIEVDDKIVGAIKVDAKGYEESTLYRLPLARLAAGPHKISVTWPLKPGQETPKIEFDPTGKLEPPGLHIRWVQIDGPRTPTAAETRWIPKDTPMTREGAETIVRQFASRAFRRPVTDVEVGNLMKLFDAEFSEKSFDKEVLKELYDFNKQKTAWFNALRQPLQAVLVSPQFLFRIEKDDQPELAGAHPITDYQLASRLSYFLWTSLPDDELLALAAKNELRNNIEAQVRRMLADPRAAQLSDNFASQWLHLRMLTKVTPDKEKFPEYSDTLKAAMAAETLKFFAQLVKEDRSILDLLDGNFTYLNEPLADLYGIVDTKGNVKGQPNPVPGGLPIKGPDFVRVELQPGQRGGILTQASVLTVTSNPGRTSPVKRGKFVLEQILGEPPPPPPPNVPSLDNPSKTDESANLRQRMEAHRANPSCAACHLEMDAIGFAFEHFNPIGRFRDKDGTFAIDATGELSGGAKFNGAAELKTVLKAKADLFAANFTRTMMTYALGRQMQYYDKPAVDKIVKVVAADGYKFSRLMVEIAKSDPFTQRRGKDQTDD